MQSLADTIRGGDPDAIAGFRDAHAARVRAYCACACTPDRCEEACEASFIEFVARIRASPGPVTDLDQLLLHSTRSAAAGRVEIVVPEPEKDETLPYHADPAICAAMPELLAARANGELRGDPSDLTRHEEGCATCAATAARMADAERAFRVTPGPEGG